MTNYIRQFVETSRERIEDEDPAYQARDKIASKWEPVTANGFSGNFAGTLKVATDGKISYKTPKDYKSFDMESPGIYDVMPSAMWLYRLACTFKPIVEFHGPDGYKLVWAASFEHKATGYVLHFYEWKGGFTLGATGEDTTTNAKFKKDVLELLNYLASDTCPHPYDGTIAGFIA